MIRYVVDVGRRPAGEAMDVVVVLSWLAQPPAERQRAIANWPSYYFFQQKGNGRHRVKKGVLGPGIQHQHHHGKKTKTPWF